jgi:cob(I)alamin adenosyltransferase
MKIYTKKGDSGTTVLIGGTRVPKHALRIESYGTMDELNAYIGVVRDQEILQEYKAQLIEIQDRIFTIGSLLAEDPKKSNMKLPEISEVDVLYLETKMDEMDELLPPMKFFVLPGGHPAVSFAHVARCVCRRAERLISHLNDEEKVQPLIMQYVNRLSDYLFVLSRKIAQDLNAVEQPWKPRM